jgi:uncharacterized protein (TIGR03435 family)
LLRAPRPRPTGRFLSLRRACIPWLRTQIRHLKSPREKYDISAESDGEVSPASSSGNRRSKADGGSVSARIPLRETRARRIRADRRKDRSHTDRELERPQRVLGDHLKIFCATNATMANFAEAMGLGALDRPVVGQAGLTGRFDFRLTWTPDETQFGAVGGHKPPTPRRTSSLRSGQELSLKLESTKASVDVLVIDHVERPSAN